MAKVAKNIVRQRPQEITAACRQLYGIMSFREITIKEISARTSLSRPSIYNYFQTKEEIFLAVLQEEYDLLADGLETVIQTNETLGINELASILGSCFDERSVMLRLLCMNLYEIEDNSRLERLAEFKRHYFSAVGKLDELLMKFIPSLDEEGRTRFLMEFLPFLNGVYPYAHPTDKQSRAMEIAGMRFRNGTITAMVSSCAADLLEAAAGMRK